MPPSNAAVRVRNHGGSEDARQHDRPGAVLHAVVDHATGRAELEGLIAREHAELRVRERFNCPLNTLGVVHGQ
jgi:hypothetical protein